MKRAIKYYFKNEKQLMKALGLVPVPGSGNGAKKEDGQNDYIIAQLKSTDSSSIVIKQTDLNTLIYNSIVSHKIPIFINQFINGQILISMRLEDIPDVANYIKCGKVDCKDDFDILPKPCSVIHKKIISTKRKSVKNKIIKEREEKYKNFK